jgi:hypothetical protein
MHYVLATLAGNCKAPYPSRGTGTPTSLRVAVVFMAILWLHFFWQVMKIMQPPAAVVPSDFMKMTLPNGASYVIPKSNAFAG